MIHSEWITAVEIGTDSSVTVEFLDGTKFHYDDPDDVKAVFVRVSDQQIRITNGEDLKEGGFLV